MCPVSVGQWTTQPCEGGHHSSATFTLCHPSQFQTAPLCFNNPALTQHTQHNKDTFRVTIYHICPELRYCMWHIRYTCFSQRRYISWIGLAPCAVMSSLWFLWEGPPPSTTLPKPLFKAPGWPVLAQLVNPTLPAPLHTLGEHSTCTAPYWTFPELAIL